MINAHLDVLELELRKLEGVRTVGFSSQHDVLYIQLFVESNTSSATLPFEATRIAQRHSSSPVAVELVRWQNTTEQKESDHAGLAAFFGDAVKQEEPAPVSQTRAGSVGSAPKAPVATEAPSVPEVSYQPEEEYYDEENEVAHNSSDEYIEIDAEDDYVDITEDDDIEVIHDSADVDYEESEERRNSETTDRIILLTVSTSSENDEIEVHLAYNEMRTIGRAPSNRGLLGAIDATVQAISELTGAHDFHAEWARSLEPGAEHASLVAVGLTNSEGTDTRHGIAGGSSPIDAAARATLNALNRVAAIA